MSKFSLDKEMKIEVKVTFITKGKDTPVTGDQYLMRLYDKDFFGEDFLGQSKLNEVGEGRIIISHEALANTEKLRDFYFVLYHNDIPVFQSKLMEDLDLESLEQYKAGEGEVIDLGTYLVGDYE